MSLYVKSGISSSDMISKFNALSSEITYWGRYFSTSETATTISSSSTKVVGRLGDGTTVTQFGRGLDTTSPTITSLQTKNGANEYNFYVEMAPPSYIVYLSGFSFTNGTSTYTQTFDKMSGSSDVYTNVIMTMSENGTRIFEYKADSILLSSFPTIEQIMESYGTTKDNQDDTPGIYPDDTDITLFDPNQDEYIFIDRDGFLDILSFKDETKPIMIDLRITTTQDIPFECFIRGPDGLIGGSANDTFIGDTGNNILNGGEGADKMTGGLGDDTYVVDNTKDKVTEKVLEGTVDTIKTTLAIFSLDKVKEVENLTYIGKSNATLTGSKTDNNITGSTGNDTLDGGLGNDTLTGGAGEDTFKFTSKLSETNIDTISDFTVADDTIQLSKKIFKAVAKGVTTDNFVLGTQAKDASDFIIYDQTTGKLYYDTDGSATKVQAIQIALIGTAEHPELTFSDFLVA